MQHSLTRRDALLSSCSAFFLSACCGTAPPPKLDDEIPRGFIDAHCHVFDAHDIPVKPFLIQTALMEEDVKQPWITLAKLLADATEIWAALGDPEREWTTNKLTAFLAPSADTEKARFQQALEKAIRNAIETGHGVRGENKLRELLAPQDRIASEVAPDFFSIQTDSGPFSLNWEAAAVLKLLDDFHIGHSSKKRIQPAITPTASFELKDVVTDDDAYQLSSALTEEASAQNTDYGAVLYVASLLMRTRNGNIEQFDKSMGLAGDVPPIVRLYAPALVDFDCWYGDTVSRPSLPIEVQCAIMAKLSKRQSDSNRFVNGYVAFDPLRALLVETQILSGPPPLQTVKDAIEQQGFIGVKLYPPMGFAPTGNSPDNASYGPLIQGWIRKLAERHGEKEYQLGPELDRILIELYRYCILRDVPIMAHCGNSQASVALAGEKASPNGWIELLNQREFRPLRVNLAHFGGFWCHATEKPTAGGDDYSSGARCAASWNWTDSIISAIAKTDATGPLYPNLYFDIADMSEITTSPEAAKNLNDKLTKYSVAAGEFLSSRLMYGTDWFFLALGGKQHVQYIPKVEALLKDKIPAANSFHVNAARFLGLVEGAQNADRLIRFYADDASRQEAIRGLVLA